MQLSGTIVKKVLPGSAADQFGIQPGWRFVSIGGFTVPQSNNEDDKEFVYGMIDKALSSEDGMVIEFKIPSESRPTSSTASTSLQRPLSSSGSQLKPQTDNSRRRCRPAFHQSLRIMQKRMNSSSGRGRSGTLGHSSSFHITGKVVARSGAYVRAGATLSSSLLDKLPVHTIVLVSEIRGRRAKIELPCEGWLSIYNSHGGAIVRLDEKAFLKTSPKHFPRPRSACGRSGIMELSRGGSAGGDTKDSAKTRSISQDTSSHEILLIPENEDKAAAAATSPTTRSPPSKAGSSAGQQFRLDVNEGGEMADAKRVRPEESSVRKREVERKVKSVDAKHLKQVSFLTKCVSDLTAELEREVSKRRDAAAVSRSTVETFREEIAALVAERDGLQDRVGILERRLEAQAASTDQARETLERKAAQRAVDLHDWTTTVANLKKLHRSQLHALEQAHAKQLLAVERAQTSRVLSLEKRLEEAQQQRGQVTKKSMPIDRVSSGGEQSPNEKKEEEKDSKLSYVLKVADGDSAVKQQQQRDGYYLKTTSDAVRVNEAAKAERKVPGTTPADDVHHIPTAASPRRWGAMHSNNRISMEDTMMLPVGARRALPRASSMPTSLWKSSRPVRDGASEAFALFSAARTEAFADIDVSSQCSINSYGISHPFDVGANSNPGDARGLATISRYHTQSSSAIKRSSAARQKVKRPGSAQPHRRYYSQQGAGRRDSVRQIVATFESRSSSASLQ